MMKRFGLILTAALLIVTLAGCVYKEHTTASYKFGDLDSLALSQGWFMEDGSCLLYGEYIGARGRQARLYRLDKPGEETACIWPLDGGWFGLEDQLLAYYLPEQHTAVLTNQTGGQMLLLDCASNKKYDTPAGSKTEITPPRLAKQGDVELLLWLAPGQYLACRNVYGSEGDVLSQSLSLYDEALQKELPLANLQGKVNAFKVDGQRNRLLFLTNLGDLAAVDLAPAEAQVWRCPELWPTPSPFNEYLTVLPVQGAEGDYVVLQVFCEDGVYYQTVDLAGEQLGLYQAQDEIGSGLVGAGGRAFYVAEYYADHPQYKMMMYDFELNESAAIQEGGSFQGDKPLPPFYAQVWGEICPDGRSLLLFYWETATECRALPTNLPLAY